MCTDLTAFGLYSPRSRFSHTDLLQFSAIRESAVVRDYACQIGSKCRNVNIYVQISICMPRSKYKCRNVNIYLHLQYMHVSTVCKNICPNRCMDLALYCLVLMYFSAYISRLQCRHILMQMNWPVSREKRKRGCTNQKHGGSMDSKCWCLFRFSCPCDTRR